MFTDETTSYLFHVLLNHQVYLGPAISLHTLIFQCISLYASVDFYCLNPQKCVLLYPENRISSYIYTGRPKKKVTVLEAAHCHVFNDRLFKFSGVDPDITRFRYMTLLLMSDGWSLS